MTRIRVIAAASAGLALFVSLLVENLLMAVKGSAVLIPGLLDYAQVWNRGVSFSLLWQNGDTGRYVLIAGLAVVATSVGILAWRAANGLTAAGYGLIVGARWAILSTEVCTSRCSIIFSCIWAGCLCSSVIFQTSRFRQGLFCCSWKAC